MPGLTKDGAAGGPIGHFTLHQRLPGDRLTPSTIQRSIKTVHDQVTQSEFPDCRPAIQRDNRRSSEGTLDVLQLQRTAGNAAVARLMRGRSQRPDHPRASVQRDLIVRSPRTRFFLPAQAADLANRFLAVLNRLSVANNYRLDGNILRFTARPGVAPDAFDTRMRTQMAPAAPEVPLVLVRRSSLIMRPGATNRVDVDDFGEGFVDVDDLEAEDPESARMNIIHLLVERATTPNYARRVGSRSLEPLAVFRQPHRSGLRAERQYLIERLHDRSIRPAVQRHNPLRFRFPSEHGYAVLHTLPTRTGGQVMSGSVTIVESSGARHTVDEWLVLHPLGFP